MSPVFVGWNQDPSGTRYHFFLPFNTTGYTILCMQRGIADTGTLRWSAALYCPRCQAMLRDLSFDAGAT